MPDPGNGANLGAAVVRGVRTAGEIPCPCFRLVVLRCRLAAAHLPQPAKLAVFGGVAAQSQLLRQQLEVLLCESSTYGKAHEIAIREIQAVHHHIRDCAEQAAKHDARQSTLQALEQFVQTNSALRALHLGQVLAACSFKTVLLLPRGTDNRD